MSRGDATGAERGLTLFESALPDDPAYWDDLAGRITADASPVLDRLYAEGGTWWAVLARRCPALATAAGIAIVATSALLAGSAPPEASPAAQVARAIGPADPVAWTYLSEGTTPRVETLLPALAPAEPGR